MSKLDKLVFDVDLYKGAHSPDSIWKLHRLNDELIRAKLNKRSNTDLAGQRGDIISCEIHFKKNKTPDWKWST